MTEVVKQEFVTPDRGPHHSNADENKSGSSQDMNGKEQALQVVTVTPAESTTREQIALKREGRESPLEMVPTNQVVETPEDRKVRFDKSENADSISDSPSSTGSQRGLVSRRGGRCASPGRIANPSPKKEAVLEFKAYRSPPRKKEATDSVPSLSSDTSPEKDREATREMAKDGAGDSSAAEKKEAGPLSSRTDGATKKKSGEKKSNVTFSPVPPPRTPTRSPTGGRFQSLPVLDDDALRSPGSFFLSPTTPTPSSRILRASGSFDGMSREDEKPAARQPMRSPKTPRSPRTPRRDERDRFMTTPTNFAMDYGKHPHSGSFDSSNVLAWLQSPTANGLFSPGGFGSMLNTPRGAPRTPRTPTVSTSFFFSDVAGLPGSDTSPKPGGDSKRGGSRGVSNIICISPLASSKTKGAASSSLTPTINYKDMFLSPEKSRVLPLLGDSPLKGSKPDGLHSASKDPSIDAVHMAERELMEDEDLSVLLQLASNTPKANGERPIAVSTSDGTHVFRSPPPSKDGQGRDENLPSLQLPVIGGREGSSNATRLSRKTHSRDHGDNGDNFHRPLGMRSSAPTGPTSNSQATATSVKQEETRKELSKPEAPKKTTSMHPPHPGYMPHHYGHPDGPYYPHMPPGVPPHSGSMRVVVGGPPPARAKSSPPRSPHARGYPMGPGDPNYPHPQYGPPGHYPHHHGVPPPHMHHYYPPPHHHPPPRHMPMYGAQHPPAKSNPATKTTKLNPSKGAKRPLPQQLPPAKPGSAKKLKKSPPSGTKKKNRSPPITDKVERQKAAANIQAVNQASGGKNDKAAALAAAILRGVTMRPSGKWQAQLYFAGKSRYIGVFDTREKAALAYEIAREKLKTEKQSAEGGTLSPKATEAAVNAARKAAFEGVNERDPRV